jgi:hypothetical protein
LCISFSFEVVWPTSAKADLFLAAPGLPETGRPGAFSYLPAAGFWQPHRQLFPSQRHAFFTQVQVQVPQWQVLPQLCFVLLFGLDIDVSPLFLFSAPHALAKGLTHVLQKPYSPRDRGRLRG